MVLTIELDFWTESIGVLLRVLSSFIFIFLLLYLFRPNIKVSPNICYMKLPNNSNVEEYYYVFKIVNKSWFSTFDVRIKLQERTPHIVNTGTKLNHRRVEIGSSAANKKDIYMPGYKRGKGIGDHAYLIRTTEDIESILEKNTSILRLNITSKHALTNLTRLKVQDFTDVKCLKKDKGFIFGKSLKTE